MGPFELMDLTGIDVSLAAATGIWDGLGRPERLRPSPIQEQLVEGRRPRPQDGRRVLPIRRREPDRRGGATADVEPRRAPRADGHPRPDRGGHRRGGAARGRGRSGAAGHDRPRAAPGRRPPARAIRASGPGVTGRRLLRLRDGRDARSGRLFCRKGRIVGSVTRCRPTRRPRTPNQLALSSRSPRPSVAPTRTAAPSATARVTPSPTPAAHDHRRRLRRSGARDPALEALLPTRIGDATLMRGSAAGASFPGGGDMCGFDLPRRAAVACRGGRSDPRRHDRRLRQRAGRRAPGTLSARRVPGSRRLAGAAAGRSRSLCTTRTRPIPSSVTSGSPGGR